MLSGPNPVHHHDNLNVLLPGFEQRPLQPRGVRTGPRDGDKTEQADEAVCPTQGSCHGSCHHAHSGRASSDLASELGPAGRRDGPGHVGDVLRVAAVRLSKRDECHEAAARLLMAQRHVGVQPRDEHTNVIGHRASQVWHVAHIGAAGPPLEFARRSSPPA